MSLSRSREADATLPLWEGKNVAWRTPMVILVCGCLISLLGFGPRSAFGFFLAPMSSANGWARDVFALALAVQMLLWGAAQPFAGALADRFGAGRVLCAGGAIYALGLAAMAHSSTASALYLSAGVLVGLGLAGSSFTLVIGAFGALMPREWRSLAFGAATAAGSFGQFLFSPLAVALIGAAGWLATLEIFAGLVLLIMPLSLALAASARTSPAKGEAPRSPAQQPLLAALAEAFGHGSYAASSPAASSCSLSPCTCRPTCSTAVFPPILPAGPSRPSACSTSSALCLRDG